MPRLVVIVAPSGAQKRLLDDELARLASEGFSLDRRYQTSSWGQLAEESCACGLFDAKRAIVVEDGLSLGPLPADWPAKIGEQDDVAVLLLYEKSPQKLLGKAAYAACRVVKNEPAPTWPDRRREWLVQLGRQEGIRLSRDAAALLVDWIEDEEELRGELDKFKLAFPGAPIGVAEVNQLSSDEGGRALLDLLDAVADASLEGVKKSLESLRLRQELIIVLSALHKRVRAAWYVTWLGVGLQKALGLTDYQTRIACKTARRWPPHVLALLTGELVRLSMAERTGDGQGWNGLEIALLGGLSACRRA